MLLMLVLLIVIGLAIGPYFKALILIPVGVIAGALLCHMSLSLHYSALSTAGFVVAGVILMQMSYLGASAATAWREYQTRHRTSRFLKTLRWTSSSYDRSRLMSPINAEISMRTHDQ